MLNKLNYIQDYILTGSLFEEIDNVLAEHLPDDNFCCMDDDQTHSDEPNFSEVHTSQVCILSDHQPSASHLPNTARSAQLSYTDDTATTTTTTKTDFDVCVEFYERTCGCKKADGKPCSSLFTLDHFVDMRAQASLMTHQEFDLVLLGSLMTTLHDHDTTVARGRHKAAKRTKITSHFMHNGYHVCINTFAFLFGIGANHCIKAIKKHYLENGMEPRVHKNSKRLPSRTASYERIYWH